ncbi:MAG: ATP-binding cassette domain-containing protein, partial [Alphaproteobacteria bacterium]|nr:ATP-binding cassette domain-containing protein [Alphaproteobacteria bacterium]
KDAELVRNTFSGATAVLLTDLPFAILFVGLIAIIAPPLVWVLLVALPVFVVVALISGAVVDRATRQEREAGMSREAFLAEMLQGRATIKSLGIDEALRPDWEEKHASTIEQASIRGRRMDGFGNLGVLLSMLTTITLVTAGALAIIDLKLTIGALIASTMLGNRVIGPFNQLVNSWRSYTNVRQALRRLDSVFALPADRTETAVKLDRPDGRITFEKVSFGYGANLPPVIDNMTMDVKAPGMLGVVGRNGCGKTTLLKLMHGLYEPTEGRVLLDGADVKQFARRDMASNIGYVAQDCFLFNGTIRDNIALTDTSATDEDIVRAATLAGVHEFAIDLPDGYDTAIGEAGSRLSGGQRQRVAIARALLPIPPVLLLDEVGANLDMQAEAALQKTLGDLAKDHSIVIVTHSPVLLQACTSIIALERGKIAIGGPAPEVLARLFGDKKKAVPAGSTLQVADGQATPAASTATPKAGAS